MAVHRIAMVGGHHSAVVEEARHIVAVVEAHHIGHLVVVVVVHHLDMPGIRPEWRDMI